MKKKGHTICDIRPGSIAEELELLPGDILLAVNNNEIEDIFDYDYAIEDEYVELWVKKSGGEELILEIEKEEHEDLGIVFENGLMDEYRSCSNHCIFCFIDQMPPGMRETLYFKDDDSRLSFLQGNYITLTNMKDRDVERIIRFHMSPINISVQTTNPELRCRMLHNRFAGQALKKIDRFYEAGIAMNGQIVLCPDINDKEELNRTIADLTKYLPHMQSVSVVPVGITKYREGLYPMRTFTSEEARETIDLIEEWQRRILAEYGTHFVHASDEFYLLGNRKLPERERYDGYLQLENGVGMLRLLTDEFIEYLDMLTEDSCEMSSVDSDGQEYMEESEYPPSTVSIATGYLAYDCIKELTDMLMNRFPEITVNVYRIRNDFFGETITVSGLITGQDLIAQLKDRDLGECLMLPINMLRSGEKVFLDDVTLDDVQKALQVPVNIVKSSGQDLVNAILGILPEEDYDEEEGWDYRPYELKENDYE